MHVCYDGTDLFLHQEPSKGARHKVFHETKGKEWADLQRSLEITNEQRNTQRKRPRAAANVQWTFSCSGPERSGDSVSAIR